MHELCLKAACDCHYSGGVLLKQIIKDIVDVFLGVIDRRHSFPIARNRKRTSQLIGLDVICLRKRIARSFLLSESEPEIILFDNEFKYLKATLADEPARLMQIMSQFKCRLH